MRLPVAAKIALHSRAWYRMIDLELLNYDLQEYVCEDSNWLDHPLVRRELRSEEDIAKANEDFEMKTREMSEAVHERDWMLFVDLHERPHRLNAVLRLIEDGISVKQLWSLPRQRSPAEIPWDQISCASFLHADMIAFRAIWIRHLSTVKPCNDLQGGTVHR